MSDKEIMGWEEFQAGLSQTFPSLLVLTAKKRISLSFNSSQWCHCLVKGLMEIQPIFPTHPDPFVLCSLLPFRTSVECSQMLFVDLQCEINLPCCCSHRGQWLGWHLSSWHPWISTDGACASDKVRKNRRLWKMSANSAVLEEQQPVWERCVHPIRALWTFTLPPPADFWAQNHPYMLHNIQAVVRGTITCFPTPSTPHCSACTGLHTALICQLGKKTLHMFPKSFVKQWWPDKSPQISN